MQAEEFIFVNFVTSPVKRNKGTPPFGRPHFILGCVSCDLAAVSIFYQQEQESGWQSHVFIVLFFSIQTNGIACQTKLSRVPIINGL